MNHLLFEWDEPKNLSNQKKHSVSFGKAMFDPAYGLLSQFSSSGSGKPPVFITGNLKGKTTNPAKEKLVDMQGFLDAVESNIGE